LISSVLHQLYTLFIYTVTLVLSTFWVQDIFDHLLAGYQKKNPTEKWQPIGGSQMLVDLIARTILVITYAILCSLI
jgi:hypothetical protein